MKFKRILSALLFCAMLLASCSTSNGNNTQGTEADNNASSESTTQSPETDELEGRRAVDDGLPEKNYNGEDFTILIETNSVNKLFEDYWYAESQNGEVINDAVYGRDSAVNERFNVGIKYSMTEGIADVLEKSVIAGDDEYQLAAFHMASASSRVTKNIYLNWYDVPYVNLSNQWWAKTNTEDLTYKGILFLAIGDLSISSLVQTYCMFFNKNLTENYNLGDIYQIVNNGEWTLDMLKSLTQNIYEDLNSNGQRDDDDLYGFVTPPATALAVYTLALGGNIFEKENDGSLVNVYMTDRTVESIDKLYSLIFESSGSYTSMKYRSSYGDAYHSMGRDFLYSNEAVFVNATFNDAITHFRSMESEFGIIPYVKLDETQKNYRTTCDADIEALMIPSSVKDIERSGIITEALCAQSWRIVIPAVYETGLKIKYSRDEESVRMLDTILDSRVFDIGYVYNFTFATHTGYASVIESLFNASKPSKDVASYVEKNREKIDKGYQSIFDYYDEFAQNKGK